MHAHVARVRGFPVTSRAGGQLASGDYKAKKTIARTKSEGLMVLQDAVVFVPFASFSLSRCGLDLDSIHKKHQQKRKSHTHVFLSVKNKTKFLENCAGTGED